MKSTILSILAAGVLIGGAIMLSSGTSESWQADNVSIQNGKQIVEITAKGKYAPRYTTAQANMPTMLKVKTAGTFDCTAALTVPAVGYKAMLEPTGVAVIDIPPQKSGSVVQGVCAMGMYNFQIRFN